MSVLNEVTYHLMIRGKDDLHAVMPCASHNGFERGNIFHHRELYILGDRPNLDK